jgi:hypothetical protein
MTGRRDQEKWFTFQSVDAILVAWSSGNTVLLCLGENTTGENGGRDALVRKVGEEIAAQSNGKSFRAVDPTTARR